MSWVYELLDNNMTTEKSALLAANVLLGLIFGVTFTIGFIEYVWTAVPMASSFITHFAAKALEPFIII